MREETGIIVIDVGVVPKTCYDCELVGDEGYCTHVGKFVDHYEFEGRYPTCPIIEKPEKDNEDYYPDEFQVGIKTGWNMCIDKILGGAE